MDAMRNSTKRNNSIEGDPSKVARDSSLERLDKDAMSLENQDLHRPNKQVNITNQINKTYILQGHNGAGYQNGVDGQGDGDGDGDNGPSAMDLQA